MTGGTYGFRMRYHLARQNPTTCIWAETGTRPSIVKQQQSGYGYLFGAVCPVKGQTEAFVSQP